MKFSHFPLKLLRAIRKNWLKHGIDTKGTTMTFTLGLGEILTLVLAAIGGFWTLLQITFRQFEKRLTEKFQEQAEDVRKLESAFQAAQMDMKRIELEQLKRDSVFIPRNEYQAALNQIFSLLRSIDEKMDRKADKVIHQ